jgi:hypothetical protein
VLQARFLTFTLAGEQVIERAGLEPVQFVDTADDQLR